MRRNRLLASASFISNIRLSAAERANGRLMRAPDGHEPGDPPEGEEEELVLDTPIDTGEPPEPPADIDDDEEEEVLTFGDEVEPQESDSALIRHLREEIRKRDKALAESSNRPEPIEVGEKPTLESCEYDEDKYDTALLAWQKRKDQADAQKSQPSPADEHTKEQWAGAFQRYSDGKAKLGFQDVDDAQATVEAVLDQAQQAVLVMAADDPAKVMYALAKNPERLADLAAESNPIRLAGKIAKLEGTLKMVKRKKAPEPEKIERGSGKISKTGADKKLAKLQEEADRTGDRTALIRYKKKLADAAK